MTENIDDYDGMVAGGKRHYGQAIGIIMYNTVAPRIPGDVGNAYTFDFPVRLKYVENLDGKWVVNKNPDNQAIPILIQAAKELEKTPTFCQMDGQKVEGEK